MILCLFGCVSGDSLSEPPMSDLSEDAASCSIGEKKLRLCKGLPHPHCGGGGCGGLENLRIRSYLSVFGLAPPASMDRLKHSNTVAIIALSARGPL